jgi:ferritin-like metal-binding protein YciE
VADVNARDAKLIQYLNEAYGKEKQLEQALTAHIQMTDLATYKKRLQQHLKETKGHARQLKTRIKQLGGKAEEVDLPGPDAVGEAATTVANVAGRAVAAAQGAVQAVRGTSQQEKLLKNAKDEYHEEAEEIANYTAIQALADLVGDKDTSKLAKAILKEEQRMASFLEKLIPRLTKEVAKAEIPAAERKPASRSRASSSRSRSTSSSRSSSSSSTSRSRSGSGSGSSSSRSSGGSSKSSSSRSGSGSSSTRKSPARSASGSSSSSARKSSSRSGSGSSSSRSRSGGSSSSRKKS